MNLLHLRTFIPLLASKALMVYYLMMEALLSSAGETNDDRIILCVFLGPKRANVEVDLPSP
jgi:hypothetical protein